MGGQALKAYIESACADAPGVEVRLVQLDALPVAREGRGRAMGKAGAFFFFPYLPDGCGLRNEVTNLRAMVR